MDPTHIYILNTLIGILVPLYIYIYTVIQTSVPLPVHCIPQYISIYEDQDLFKIFLNNVNLIES